MCGIVGIYSLSGEPVLGGVLSKMTALMQHRGPDDSGQRFFSLRQARSVVVNSDNLTQGHETPDGFEGGLGFVRLSILDVSTRGHQPMSNDAGDVFLAFNGEIYNAFEFKPELEAAGYNFRGHSDTEILLRLYEHYGLEGMLERINGMFAVAIVDLRNRCLTLVRDGLGIKPIYWYRCGDTILFASEIKSFLAYPGFDRQLSHEHIDEYLAFRYCSGEGHLLKGVRALKPGHLLRITAGQEPSIHRYFEIPDPEEIGPTAHANAADELDELLRKAVASQLVADVRVGCQLSGGLDSSLVAQFANSTRGNGIEAFSIVFDKTRYSEDTWISEATEKAALDNHRFFFTADDFFNTLDRALWHLEQPINHPNTLGIFVLAQKSRAMVKVLLTGEGADELMGGYNRFYYGAVRPHLSYALPILSRVPRIGERWTRNFGLEAWDETDFFIASSMHTRPNELSQIRPQTNLNRLLDERRSIFAEGRGDYLSNCMKYEMQTHLVDLLIRQDKMTMAHSIEGRIPFLDREVVSYVRSLPPSAFVGDALFCPHPRVRNTKRLLKTVAAKYFSKDFVYRSKSGFSLPLVDYYTDPRFVELMEERVLPGLKNRGVIDVKPLTNWWRNVEDAPRTLDETYWIPIMFELWAQQWLDIPKATYVDTYPTPALRRREQVRP